MQINNIYKSILLKNKKKFKIKFNKLIIIKLMKTK